MFAVMVYHGVDPMKGLGASDSMPAPGEKANVLNCPVAEK